MSNQTNPIYPNFIKVNRIFMLSFKYGDAQKVIYWTTNIFQSSED